MLKATPGGKGVTQWPCAQLCPDGQVPHESVMPQPSLMVPHSRPCATQDVGTHVLQLWSTASHTVPSMQLPHASMPPQPSATVPHSFSVVQSRGVQVEHWPP